MSEYGGWPTLAEFRRVLDVDPESTLHDETLSRVLAAAIQDVKDETGAWDDFSDLPTPAQAQAALRRAELFALRPEAAGAAAADPTYQRLVRGTRRRFAIS